MALDMFLIGEKFFLDGSKKLIISEDGFKLKAHLYEMGYWLKHPNLHGFIVESFKDGDDDCNPVYLDIEAIDSIIAAIKNKTLPFTDGPSFGKSKGDITEQARDLDIFVKAKKWLTHKQRGESRRIYYQGGW